MRDPSLIHSHLLRVVMCFCRAMRPLMGLENSRLAKPAAVGAASSAVDEDEEEGASAAAHNDQLLRALQSIGGYAGAGSKAAGDDDEDAADYAALDAMCKAPGGACEIPTKKQAGGRAGKKKGGNADDPSAASPSADSPDASSSAAVPRNAL